MINLNEGAEVFVQSYKHNGSLHRTWSKAIVIEDNDDFIVAVTDHTWVVESDRRRWLTKEPAICFFYKKKWFNVISMVRKAGIYYYINIASPSLVDDEAIKNIDYDLDVKVFPDNEYIVLDRNEYDYHSNLMGYSQNLKNRIEESLEEIIGMVENKEKPFDFSYINDYLMKYFKIVFKNNENN